MIALLGVIQLGLVNQTHAAWYPGKYIIKMFQSIGEETTDLGGESDSPCQASSQSKDQAILSTKFGEKFAISVVSAARARELHNAMAAQKHIPFGYPEDGCYARAHEMARILEEDYGVIVGKIFAKGNLRVKTTNSPKGEVTWIYHMAPVVAVPQTDGELTPMAIDPSLFAEPVTVEDWLEIQETGIGHSVKESYFTKRFAYKSDDATIRLNAYKDSDWVNARERMAKYLEVQKTRKTGPVR